MSGQQEQPSGTQDDKERRRQQGDAEGPESSQGVDPEPGRPTDKVPKPTGADTKSPARERSSPAAGDEQVNTGGLPGPDNSD
jgi:hypothetical protein